MPMTIDGATVMIPVHNAPAFESPYIVAKPDTLGRSQVSRDGAVIGEVKFQLRPRFYERSTADGIPYSKIATLHGRDVLATTILQTCIRYQSRTKTCQFCAIGQSLAAGRTIERKTPGATRRGRQGRGRTRWRHPHGDDHGHAARQRSRRENPVRERDRRSKPRSICRSRASASRRMTTSGSSGCAMPASIRSACIWKPSPRASAPASCRARRRCRSSVTSRRSRRRCRCSAAARSRPTSWPASATARKRSSTICERLVGVGVYPFVVPFVPIAGTPLESHPTPPPSFMHDILSPLSDMLVDGRHEIQRHQGRLRQMRRLLGALDLREEGAGMMFEPFKPFLASAYQIKFATEAWEKARRRRAAPAGVLRRAGPVRRRRSRRDR